MTPFEIEIVPSDKELYIRYLARRDRMIVRNLWLFAMLSLVVTSTAWLVGQL
jgi:hypothetical protein